MEVIRPSDKTKRP